MTFFSRVHATLNLALSVGRLYGWSVGLSHFTYFMIFIFGPHCSCPNGPVTSNMVPVHPHATSVAVYPALFLFNAEKKTRFVISLVFEGFCDFYASSKSPPPLSNSSCGSKTEKKGKLSNSTNNQIVFFPSLDWCSLSWVVSQMRDSYYFKEAAASKY